MRHDDEPRTGLSQPSSGPARTRRRGLASVVPGPGGDGGAHPVSCSPRARAGTTPWTATSYSARAWRSARDRFASRPPRQGRAVRWAGRAPLLLVPGLLPERADVERHDDARDAARPQRRERPDPGSVERRRDDDGGHARAEGGPTVATSASTSGARPVAVDGGQELHDLEVLAAAAVGRQVRESGGRSPSPRPHGSRGSPCRRSDAAARIATSTVDSSPGRPGCPLEVQDDPRVGGLLQVELLDLDLAEPGGATASGSG